MPWEKVPAFLKSHPCWKKTVDSEFATQDRMKETKDKRTGYIFRIQHFEDSLAYRCLQMKWGAAVTVVAIPLLHWQAPLMCRYICSGKFSVLTHCCFLRTLTLFGIGYSLITYKRFLSFAIHFTTMILPWPVFLAFCVSRELAGHSNHFQKTFYFRFATKWYVLSLEQGLWYCSSLACRQDFKNILSSIHLLFCRTLAESQEYPVPCHKYPSVFFLFTYLSTHKVGQGNSSFWTFKSRTDALHRPILLLRVWDENWFLW